MEPIENAIFSIWLNEAETARVNTHVRENFVYIEYGHTDRADRLFGKLNTVTREVMLAECTTLQAYKCILVIVSCPFYMAFRFSKQLVNSVSLVIQAVADMDVFAFGRVLLDLLEIPYFAVGMELAAILGLLYDPTKARERVGLMEKKLNKDIPWTDRRSTYLYKCLQPWVYNIDAPVPSYRIYTSNRNEMTAQNQRRVDSFEVCSRCWPLPLIPCCV